MTNPIKTAFSDMKESARAQHEIDKANLAAVRAESRANFQQARAGARLHKQEQLAAAQERIDRANEAARAAEDAM